MKNMTKGKAFLVLLVMILALAGISYLDIFGIDATGKGSASNIKLGLDLAGGVSITYQVVGEEPPSSTDMADTISKLQQRVWNYSTEAVVYQEGLDRISIEIPGVSDANAILTELGRPGALYFISQVGADGTDNYSYGLTQDENGNQAYEYVLNKTIDELKADGSIVLEGTDIQEATAANAADNMGNTNIIVRLMMTSSGKEKFAQATRVAYGDGVNRQTIGIYYDGKFVSVPRVSAVISDGVAQIDGMADFEEAEKLASTIRIGGLSLELEELHSKVVGAQLGVDAIETSLKAGVIGLIIVAVFMILVYFLSGLAAAFALCLYVAMIVMLLKGFDMTLTLSGIAGIILSIGMAVDANVIIFARIREELATGKTVKSAMKIGFEKALSAIVDGNITTLIAAAVLWVLGPGTVKGFAQTLALGIVLSMFTALVLTRLIMQALYTLGCKSEKLYGVGKEPKAFDFLSKRNVFFGISIALIVAGFVVMGVYAGKTGDALNLSLEFKGGTATNVTFQNAMTLDEVNSKVVPVISSVTGNVQIQTVQDSNEVIFKSDTLDKDQRKALEDLFVDEFGVNREEIVSETISSTISDEMTRSTIVAVIVAIICMLIYIRIRFKDIRLGAASVTALLHDVLVVLAFYAVARVSVSNTFVACMLTIVGYSINATIVIFDRIRENMNEMKRTDKLEEVINKSIAQTLSRSVFTSFTTFIMVAVLYILGVSSIRDFALPLMVGIFCGTYSSICLAGSLWYAYRKLFPQKSAK